MTTIMQLASCLKQFAIYWSVFRIDLPTSMCLFQ